MTMKKLTTEQQAEMDLSLLTPHQLYVADELMNIKIQGPVASLTLGYTSFGKLNPVCTFNCTTSFLLSIADQINQAVKDNHQAITDSAKELETRLKKIK
jgi:hypothetical protein